VERVIGSIRPECLNHVIPDVSAARSAPDALQRASTHATLGQSPDVVFGERTLNSREEGIP
jgi:hypothetical protein